MLETKIDLPHHTKACFNQTFFVAHDILEAPRDVMLLDVFMTLMLEDYNGSRRGWSAKDAELRKRLQVYAAIARARVRQSPPLQAYYQQRQLVRDMGGDPDTVPKPKRGRRPEQLRVRSERGRLLETAQRPLPDASLHRAGDRSADAVNERRQLYAERAEVLAAQRALRRIDRTAWLAETAEWEKLVAQGQTDLPRPVPSQWALSDVERARWDAEHMPMSEQALVGRRMRAEHRGRQPWAERALEDLATLQRLGRPVPTATRHPAGAVPLWQRAHHAAT